MQRKSTFFLTLLLLGSLLSMAQNSAIQKQKFHWGRGDSDTATGYAQAVLVDNVLYISGTVGGGDMATAVQRVYSGLERTLAHYGATFQNVVKENLFTTDIEAVKQHNGIRKAFYKGDYPAATWVQISRLYMPQATLEVEVVAHLPKK
jgi:enamine deaminase RidA (YjgF/YER057c/UK114 family)